MPTDDDLVALVRVIESGIHDPTDMPFDDPPWTDEPSPQRERDWMQRQWGLRSDWDADSWALTFGVFRAGRALGMQQIFANEFPAKRLVTSYSWLGRAFQGQGHGKAMRAAVLHFAFIHLGATRADSAAFTDNLSSIGVSLALGYERNGIDIALRRGRPTEEACFLLTRERWEQGAAACFDVAVEGMETCREMFGLD